MVNSPQNMRTLQLTIDGQDFGPNKDLKNVLKEREQNVPELRDSETLVEIRYVGIGQAEISTLRVQRKDTVPGFDLAGIVVQDKSGRWKKGDRVFGVAYGGLGSTIKDDRIRERAQIQGSFAEYAIVDSDKLMRIPENESLEKCAALPFSLLVAFQALGCARDYSHKAQSHEAILITGGATMIGLSAIQLAHRMGYRVLTTTSQNHFNLVKEFGADKVYDFKEANLGEKIRNETQNNLERAIDAIGQGNSLTTAYQAMGSKGGRVSTIIPREQREQQQQASGRNDVQVEMNLPTTLWGHDAQWEGINFKAQSNEHKNTTAFLRDVEKWLQQKELRTLPTQRVNEHGLDGVLQGMEKVRNGQVSGVRLVACVRDDQ